jgi:Transcriptional regulator
MNDDEFFGDSFRSPRAEQKEQTRTHILVAALALLRDAGEEAVTIKAVAAASAGVTERTVYRHFKSRDVLLRSAWHLMEEVVAQPPPPRTPGEFVERPRSYFPPLEQHGDLVRAYLYSQSRAGGRGRRVDKARSDALIECVQTNMEYLDEGKLRRRTAIADLIASPYALEWMQQFWGFNGKEAGEAAAEALDILINLGLAY